MTHKKLGGVFRKEKIAAIKRHIGRCFRGYKIHYNTEDPERFAWIFSLRSKKKNDRRFSVIVQETLFENLNESEISSLSDKHDLNDYLGDSVKRIVIDYKRGERGGEIKSKKEKE